MSSPPRLFVSYSWTTPEHEQWVLDLATELVDSGVKVVLDKWDLREGHDSIAFMESMVTDKTISKVILICDKAYAEKADGRAGGVGTETQIISAEVYAKRSQDKFVAVLAEKNDAGKPYLPTYYKSRIYIDLSESALYAENFEKLLRWIFDKPLHIRPQLGKPPSYIVDAGAPLLGTTAIAKRVIEGAKGDKGYLRGALDEYLSTYSENLERFRVSGNDGEPDDRIIKSIEELTPSRIELIQVLTALIQYADATSHVPRIHRFFESLIPYLVRPPRVDRWTDIDSDNFKFIVHELFLYSLALLLRAENVEAATHLLSQPYYIGDISEFGKSTVNYAIFSQHMRSLDIRNKRLKSGRLSLRADLLEQRSRTSGVQFRHLMQADFVSFMRAEFVHTGRNENWWPDTLVFAGRQHGPFELFARCTSKAYLARVLPLIGVADLSAIKSRLEGLKGNRTSIPSWGFDSFSPADLLGFDQLGTRP